MALTAFNPVNNRVTKGNPVGLIFLLPQNCKIPFLKYGFPRIILIFS